MIHDLGAAEASRFQTAEEHAYQHLRNLILLDLAENLVEDRGAHALADSPHLDGLIHLNLSGNVISPDAARRLRKRFGDRVFL